MVGWNRLPAGAFLVYLVSILIVTRNACAFSPTNAFPHAWHQRRRDSCAIRSSYRNDDIGDGGTRRPIPAVPSDLFQDLAMSQLELLANSLQRPSPPATNDGETPNQSKIKSMALYLPQENVNTGQLEFLPIVIYPHPSTERVFIASDSDSKVAPTLPKLLTKLPGFAPPNSLLPRYPMISTTTAGSAANGTEHFAGVGVVEEVLCDVRSGTPALSVPLFLGSQTVGVLLVSPFIPSTGRVKRARKVSGKENLNGEERIWTANDREQIARAARTLSMALNMDTERKRLELQNHQVKNALSDSLHQVKNPLQALRTFGKLLQRRVASVGEGGGLQNQAEVGTTLQLLELTQNLMEQSDRVVELLAPIDSLVDSMGTGNLRYLNPATPSAPTGDQSLVPWDQANPPSLPWESDTIEFARRETNRTEFSSSSPSPTSAVSSNSANTNFKKRDSSGTIEFSHKRRPRQGGTTRALTGMHESTPGEKTRNERHPSASNATFAPSKSTANASTSTTPRSTPPPSSSSSSIVGDDDDEVMAFIFDVLQPIFSVYKAIGEERGISFEILGLELADELPGVLMRRKAIQEAVSNLLDNAFKYGALRRGTGEQKNPPPCVRVRLMPNNPREMPAGCSLVVEDNGPGVPPGEAAAIFERGFRSPTTSSQAAGTGIGLDISRSLLESMGGSLECLVRNKGGRGTKSFLQPELLDGAVFRVSLFRKGS